MNVAIFGLGYVGCVTAACLARDGHHVTGVDIKPEKIAAIRAGRSPIIEPGLAQLIQSAVTAGRLQATHDPLQAVHHADLLLICVGTPSHPNGDLDLSHVKNVFRDVGRALAATTEYKAIVIRSTILPGRAASLLLPLLEQESGLQAGRDFGFCVNPEFLREGTAIHDFDHPPFTIIGQLDEPSGDRLAELYARVEAPLHRIPLGAAEMVKYASNAFHALKVTFANEIGNLCQTFGLDSHQVMDIFVQDTQLNLSPTYLKPGFAFGGSCLPKDLRALLYAARQQDLRLPVLEGILPSNELQTQRAVDILLRNGRRKVGLVGLSFKPHTDDLRESPAIELVERLLGKGFELTIYDREVSLSHLHGSNRAYLEQTIPHISSLMRPTLHETVSPAAAIVIAKQPLPDEYDQLIHLLRPDHILIDLVRLNGQVVPDFGGRYYGICW